MSETKECTLYCVSVCSELFMKVLNHLYRNICLILPWQHYKHYFKCFSWEWVLILKENIHLPHPRIPRKIFPYRNCFYCLMASPSVGKMTEWWIQWWWSHQDTKSSCQSHIYRFSSSIIVIAVFSEQANTVHLQSSTMLSPHGRGLTLRIMGNRINI